MEERPPFRYLKEFEKEKPRPRLGVRLLTALQVLQVRHTSGLTIHLHRLATDVPGGVCASFLCKPRTLGPERWLRPIASTVNHVVDRGLNPQPSG